ncbi:hypothetical protein H310_08667 [Aphanomyces invadans]|uniref:Uncharacterized protein n=1 Tax=Aphanomyces invadans TaxID=157072 RepID=A0A024TWZ9_9STRA|nr:hypothetical protein H310_08667 [Aphanomyces invadans]ETV98543.1 hypothetical protein H310_08667 [Aphanomyces invadans]|eukprot:XP_008872740.1 hypothetical protein H310_08667 [Aphanomyces invadans]
MATIDRDTDLGLQRVVRAAFASSKVLTHSHRVDTVLDHDRNLEQERNLYDLVPACGCKMSQTQPVP